MIQWSLRRADHLSRGILPTVVRPCVWSRNLKNEAAQTRKSCKCRIEEEEKEEDDSVHTHGTQKPNMSSAYVSIFIAE